MHKKDEKITIIATVNVILEDLRAQLNSFFIHTYITRMQAAHSAKLIAESNDFTITCRIDLSKNGALVQQDEIQSAHWTHTQVTIFTAHACINQGVLEESFTIVSDNLNHTKEAVYTFMPALFHEFSTKYPSIKVINIFIDGADSSFKQ